MIAQHALIISLAVLFIHSTTWEGMIFEGVKKWIKPEGMLYKPIYGCPICMTAYWGTLLYCIFISWIDYRTYFLTMLAACGFSVIWVVLIDLKDAAIVYIKKNKE